jgi:hypothetical protein
VRNKTYPLESSLITPLGAVHAGEIYKIPEVVHPGSVCVCRNVVCRKVRVVGGG